MANIGIYFWQEQRILEKEDYLSEIKKLQKRKKVSEKFPDTKILRRKIKAVFRQKACNIANFLRVLPISSVLRKEYL